MIHTTALLDAIARPSPDMPPIALLTIIIMKAIPSGLVYEKASIPAATTVRNWYIHKNTEIPNLSSKYPQNNANIIVGPL